MTTLIVTLENRCYKGRFEKQRETNEKNKCRRRERWKIGAERVKNCDRVDVAHASMK